MVLYDITQDIPNTGLMYVYTKISKISGYVNITYTTNNQNVNINMASVRVTVVTNTPLYSQVKIEGSYISPLPHVLNRFEFGGYAGDGTPLIVTNLSNIGLRLPAGSYYITAVISLQTPANFDFFVS